MYRALRMTTRLRNHTAVAGAAAILLGSACAPRGVQSPVEKSPPAEIEEARSFASAGDADAARRTYEAFLAAHPGTIEADLARLELGVLEAASRGCDLAMTHFVQAQDSQDTALSMRASLRVADCQLEQKEPDQALRTLSPVARQRFSDPEQEMLWHTAVEASEQTLDAPIGLEVMDGLFASGGAPPDAARAEAALGLLAMKLAIEQAIALLDDLSPGGPAQVAVARRTLEHGLATQDADLIARSADIIRANGDPEDPEIRVLLARADEFVHGNPFVVGALLPLTGRGREVGQQLLKGMQLAALQEGGPEIVVEDTGGSAEDAGRAAERLVQDARVVAMLGPVGTRTTAAAAEATEQSGVPLLTFSVAEHTASGGGEVFRALYNPREEVRALVRRAEFRGDSSYAILYPDHGYGRTLSRLYAEEVAAVGGSMCPGVAYPPDTRSFVEPVKALLEQGCETVLLADTGNQVASIAPTFAAEGAWSTAGGRLPDGATREVHFLLPSLAWSPNLLARAGRYLQGTLAVVPFYEAAETAANLDFREAYEERYGRPPQTFAAYGYDVYRLIASTLRRGNATRETLAEALRAGEVVSSVTSLSGFSSERVPSALPPVYEVRGTTLIRAD